MRPFSVIAIAAVSLLAAVVLTPKPAPAQEIAPLGIVSHITYNVKSAEGPVRVVWDVQIENNDPDTANNGGGTIFFYEDVQLPVVRGASNATAVDGNGRPLAVTIDDPSEGVAQRAAIAFAEPLYFRERYDLQLTYELPDTRFEGILITPTYAYLPLIAAGDEATVNVNTPSGEAWEVTLEAGECEQRGNSFSCTGSGGAYLAATVEVYQPNAIQVVSFEVQLQRQLLAVNLTYLQGEDAAAQHQRDLVTSGLPLIEDAMGFGYAGPKVLNIAQSGRQSVLGYEGLTSCGEGVSCEVVISPVADDYTVLHELSHLWSSIFAKRWLSEGFAQLTPRQAAPLLPDGLLSGPQPQRPQASVPLQLDEWGDVETVIGADDAQLALIDAAYDYSLRFLEELESRFGADTLRAVNRNIAGSGEAADSQRFMDVLEEATGENLDELFLIWVFPDSFARTLEERREAKTRLADLRTRLVEADLPDDALVSIQANIRDWMFEDALASIEALESNIDTYAELTAEMEELEASVRAAGLLLPSDILDALLKFEFHAARSQLGEARDALAAYVSANRDVGERRNLWVKFGLLGSDPEGELRAAEEAFTNAEFDISQEHSENAIDLIADAGSVALRRMLIVGGFLSLLLLALVAAFAIGQLRQREMAER